MARADFLYLIGISCVLAVLQIEARLTETPKDALASPKDSVTFRCFTERKDYPPSWYHTKVGSSEARDVYTIVRNGNGNGNGNGIVGRMTQEYHEQMEVLENRTTGEYSLRIKSVQSDDAGQYRCTARGGLGQSASAELIVIESAVQCRANTSKALGESICDHDPDYVKMSCSFRVKGNHFPSVSWVKTDEMESVLRTETAHETNEPGGAASEYILRADAFGLNSSSFTCILNLPQAVDDDRFRCTTSAINVLKFSEYTNNSKTLISPEEVQCPSIPLVAEMGCKWVKRQMDQPESPVDTEVAKTRTLNLFRPEMDSGLYICIIDCNIENKHCPVEAMTVTYQCPAVVGTSSTMTVVITIFGTIFAVAAASAITVVVVLYVVPYIKRKLARPETRENGLGNGRANHQHVELQPWLRNPIHGAYDIPDAKLGNPGDKNLRLRQIEEKARARMQMNAALRQGSSSRDDGDVAEGLHFSTDKKSS